MCVCKLMELTISIFVFPYKPCANTDTTNTLMMNDTNNAAAASMKKYMLASRTLAGSRLFTSRDYSYKENTNRKKLFLVMFTA